MKRNKLIVRTIYLALAWGVSQLVMDGEDGNLLVRIVIIVGVFAILKLLNWLYLFIRTKQ